MNQKLCYAYSLRGQRDELAAWAETLGGGVAHWVADTSQLTMGTGLPEEWREQGAAFAEKGELRWWRDGDAYRALLLTDEPVSGQEPLPGSWTRDEGSVLFFLQSLDAPHVRPSFDRYPHGHECGRMEAVIYRCNGVVVFVSPRRLLAEKKER